jgi:hypothetical protein
MDFIYRSEAPRYKGTGAQPQQQCGGPLAWFWRLFGGASQPAYRQYGASIPPSTPPSGSAQPQYRAAPEEEPMPEGGVAVAARYEDPTGEGCGEDKVPEAVPTEIHIW